jgi:hypothetical protein
MAQEPNYTNTHSSSKQTQKQSAPSHQKNPVTTQRTSSGNLGKKESRNAKRRRWAKNNRPKVAPKVISAPTLEYVSACCSVPARKPKAGQKEVAKDPETGKIVNQPKGLGHWTCTGCNKKCKVTPGKPQPKTEVPNGEAVTQASN